MDTRGRESAPGKEKRGTSSSHQLHGNTTQQNRRLSLSRPRDPPDPPASEKHIPNYLKPTLSSSPDVSKQLVKKQVSGDASKRRNLTRTRSLDKDGSSSHSHTPKTRTSPNPTLRSSSFSAKTTIAQKSIPDKLLKSSKDIELVRQVQLESRKDDELVEYSTVSEQQDDLAYVEMKEPDKHNADEEKETKTNGSVTGIPKVEADEKEGEGANALDEKENEIIVGETFDSKGTKDQEVDAEMKHEAENAAPQQQSAQGKKNSAVSNDVIEETASKLREQRRNKVRALAGAFETVISLQEPK